MLLLDQFGYLLAIAIHHPVNASWKNHKNDINIEILFFIFITKLKQSGEILT